MTVSGSSDLENYGHDERAFLGLLGDVALQVGADLFFDHAIVPFFFFAGVRERIFDDALGAFHQIVVAGIEATGDDLGSGFGFAGQFVDGDDGQNDAVFAEVQPVFDNQIFNHVGAVAGVDANAAHFDASGFARAKFVE